MHLLPSKIQCTDQSSSWRDYCFVCVLYRFRDTVDVICDLLLSLYRYSPQPGAARKRDFSMWTMLGSNDTCCMHFCFAILSDCWRNPRTWNSVEELCAWSNWKQRPKQHEPRTIFLSIGKESSSPPARPTDTLFNRFQRRVLKNPTYTWPYGRKGQVVRYCHSPSIGENDLKQAFCVFCFVVMVFWI